MINLTEEVFKMLDDLEKMANSSTVFYKTISLEPCKPWQTKTKAPAQNKEEKDMCYASAATINVADNTEKDQRKYLKSRLYDAFYEKKADAKRKFGLVDDKAPANAEELIDRIKNGKFTVTPKEQRSRWEGPFEAIRWRDPSVKEDKDGYEAAKAELEKAFKEAEDVIVIKTPSEGLDAVKAFQALEVK